MSLHNHPSVSDESQKWDLKDLHEVLEEFGITICESTVDGAIAEASRNISMDSAMASLPSEAVSGTSTKFSCFSRMGHELEVDTEITRGLTLRDCLKYGGCMWYTSPSRLTSKQCNYRWKISKPCKKYDMFLSHTWNTSGLAKHLAILLQSGWPIALCFWVVAQILIVILCVWDVIPVPYEFPPGLKIDGWFEIPLVPWTILTSCFSLTLGFLMAPYFPRLGRAPDTCFLDVACVNQSDRELTERAVYGLGGFLAMSDELRVLWSAPYLSRLWCVFELAAYRPANPTGKISFRPIYMELSVLIAVPTIHLINLLSYVCAVHLRDMMPLIPFSIVCLSCCVHLLRRSHRGRLQLMSDLKSFDIQNASCANAFDHEFVMSSIARWYGSTQSFTNFVRGPLREELAPSINATGFQTGYVVLMCLSGISYQNQACLQFWAEGASWQFILLFAVSSGLAYAALYAFCVANLMLHLSSRLASRWRCDYLPSVFVTLVIWILNLIGTVIGQQAPKAGLIPTLPWCIFAAVVAILTLRAK